MYIHRQLANINRDSQRKCKVCITLTYRYYSNLVIDNKDY